MGTGRWLACRRHPSRDGGSVISELWQSLWRACGVVTIAAGVLAGRSRRWLYAGLPRCPVLFLICGALVHMINLTSGLDTNFADTAHFT